MLAKAALDKLCKLQIIADAFDDDDKDEAAVIQQEELISKLRDEIDILSSSKQQLEDAISRVISQGMLMHLKTPPQTTNNDFLTAGVNHGGVATVEAENGESFIHRDNHG